MADISFRRFADYLRENGLKFVEEVSVADVYVQGRRIAHADGLLKCKYSATGKRKQLHSDLHCYLDINGALGRVEIKGNMHYWPYCKEARKKVKTRVLKRMLASRCPRYDTDVVWVYYAVSDVVGEQLVRKNCELAEEVNWQILPATLNSTVRMEAQALMNEHKRKLEREEDAKWAENRDLMSTLGVAEEIASALRKVFIAKINEKKDESNNEKKKSRILTNVIAARASWTYWGRSKRGREDWFSAEALASREMAQNQSTKMEMRAALLLDYMRVLAHSQASEDWDTKEKYDQLYEDMGGDARSWIKEVFEQHSFHDVLMFVVNHIFTGKGIGGSKFVTHFEINLCSALCGLPETRELEKIWEVSTKKVAIAVDELMSTNNQFVAVGMDTHVRKFAKACYDILYFAWVGEPCEGIENLTEAEQTPIGIEKFYDFFSRTMGPEVGYWINEILGMLAQMLNGEANERAFAVDVYQTLIRELVHEHNGHIQANVIEALLSQYPQKNRNK